MTIYTNANCPLCNVLKLKLKSKDIEYTEVTDVEVAISKGIQRTPVLEVDDQLLDFSSAIKYINTL